MFASIANKAVAVYFTFFGVMMMFATRTMASGYGCEVGDDVIMFMKWMGMNQLFIAWFASLSSRQTPKTQGVTCLSNAILLAFFLGDSLVNGEAFFAAGGMPTDGLYFNIISFGILFLLCVGGWVSSGTPVPSLGVANGQPLCMTANTVLCLVFGLLMIFKTSILRDQFMTHEDGTKSKDLMPNSGIFMNEMFKWIGMMQVGAAARFEFMFGQGKEAYGAKYETLRCVALQWALHTGMGIVMEFAQSALNYPYTVQTQWSNFIMWFGMFYWCMYTLVHMAYPANAAVDKKTK